MDASSPWVPTLSGKVLPALSRIEELVENEQKPSPDKDEDWSKSNIKKILAGNPDAIEPMWECVVGLWRLRRTKPSEDDEEDDDLWRQHVSAWLVRRDKLIATPIC